MHYKRRIDLGFFVAFILICSMAASIYASFKQLNHQKQLVEHTFEVINTLQDTISDLKDVQGSVRGYVITGLEEYLAPYYIALPQIDDNIVKLSGMVSDNPEQIKRMKFLQELVTSRVHIAQETLEIYKTRGQKAAFEKIKSGAGKREMDEIRVVSAEMVAVENNLLDKRRVGTENSSRLTMIAGALGVAICLVILITVFSIVHSETRRRAETEDALRDAMSKMERHTEETILVSRMGDYLRGCRDRHEVYDVIANSMPTLFPASFGSISIFNNSRNMLMPALTWGMLPQGVELEFEYESCWALRQGRGHLATPDNSAPICPHLEHVEKNYVSFCLPMQAQGETIGQIYFGALAADAKYVGAHEMGMMRRITEQISLAIANLNLQQALREQSIKDPLTKLFNRRYLEETLTREIARAARHQLPIAVLIMDIDFFKKVNDTYGHDGGDAVLVAFAKMLGTKIRKEDMACRLGGEEFVLVLPAASVDLAKTRAEDICKNTRDLRIKHQNQVITITVSIGVAMFPEDGTTPEDILQNADVALYKAKREGRDQAVIFDPSMALKSA